MAAAPSRPDVKILLDEMYPAAIAHELRERGHDVAATVERVDLAGLPDPALFAAAQIEERAMVTENVSDFMPLHNEYASSGRDHHGLIFTSNSAFPRGAPDFVGALVKALDALLTSPPDGHGRFGWIHWLSRGPS
jgi:hypothetical protein